MPHQISIAPSGHQCAAVEGASVLDAALGAGFLLPYSCRTGTCGTCKGRLLAGQVDPGRTTDSVLLPAEREAGYVLFCCAKPLSDITIQCREFQAPGEIQLKKFSAKVVKLHEAAPDVMVVHLELPFGKRLQFLPGQYIDIVLPDGRKRAFSLANAPHDDEVLELHIRHMPGGEFTSFVFDELQLKDPLRIEGPHGHFHWREAEGAAAQRPVLLVAGGTGFAPIKAMVQHALHSHSTRNIWLYWGAQHPDGLYMHELAQQWTSEHPQVHYVPVISAPQANGHWAGRTGLVHEAVLQDWPSLANCDVYLCGSEAMTAAARAAFTQHWLDPHHLYCDVFCAARIS